MNEEDLGREVADVIRRWTICALCPRVIGDEDYHLLVGDAAEQLSEKSNGSVLMSPQGKTMFIHTACYEMAKLVHGE